MAETYEDVRESATGEAAETWKAIDRERSALRQLYRQLQDDPKYSDEYKAETAWKRYENARKKIEEGVPKAREAFERQARTAEQFSIPMPAGEAVTTTDTQKLLASQNEATRLVRRIDRMAGAAKGPFRPDKAKILKAEYQRGLEVGGVQGGAICRGVLMACEELGIDVDPIVDGHRRESHSKALETAQRAWMYRNAVVREVPKPPFQRPHDGRVPGGVFTQTRSRSPFK